MTTMILLLFSNVFMTVAWYWHLLAKDWPLWSFILVSCNSVNFSRPSVPPCSSMHPQRPCIRA